MSLNVQKLTHDKLPENVEGIYDIEEDAALINPEDKVKGKLAAVYPSSFNFDFSDKFSGFKGPKFMNSDYLIAFSMKIRSTFRVLLLILYIVCGIIIIVNGDSMMFYKGEF